MTQWVRRHRRVSPPRDESGAIAVMAAVIVMVVVVASSLAVDVGRVAYTSRDQQGATDRAALDAVTVVASSASNTFEGVHRDVHDAVEASLARNRGTDGATARDREIVSVQLGRMGPTGFEAICDKSAETAAPDCTSVDNLANPAFPLEQVDAVRVDTTSFVPFVFALGDDEGGRTVDRFSVAELAALAGIRVGSDLVGVSDGLLESTLDDLICEAVLRSGESTCSLDVTAVGYRGLLEANVTIGDLVDELDAVLGSPDEVLTAEATIAQFLTAVANVLDAHGHPDQAQVLRDIVVPLPTDDLTVPLGELVDFTTATPEQAAEGTLNVLQLVQASFQVANRDQLLDLPNLNATVPGVGGLDASLQIIESAQTAYGPASPTATGWATEAHTAQARLGLDTGVTLDVLTPLENALSALSLGTVTVGLGDVHLPLGVEAARATASLTDIACETVPEPDTTILTKTEAAQVVLGDYDPATDTLTPGDVTQLTVTLGVSVPLVGMVPVLEVDIDVDAYGQIAIPAASDIPPGHDYTADQHVTSEDPDEPQLTYPRGPHRLAGDLTALDNLDAADLGLQITSDAQVLSMLYLPGTEEALESSIVNAVTSSLVSSLGPLVGDVVAGGVDPLLASMGVALGNADTWADWANCEGRRLAPRPAPTVSSSP